MKCQVTKEIFVVLRDAVPMKHYAFSSPMPEIGFYDRREHFRGSGLCADVIYTGQHVEYWLFAESNQGDNSK